MLGSVSSFPNRKENQLKSKLFTAFLAVSFLGFLLTGCASANYVQHPGSINLFSSQSYDALVTADAAIKQAKTDLGTFPVAWQPKIKSVLNTAIQAYNVADLSWQTYNASATAANQTALNANLSTLQTAMANLTTAKAGQ